MRRKRELCRELLREAGATIGFVDVGSGGPLKRPWSLLPEEHVQVFPFEPTEADQKSLPLCVSNREGIARFHVAHDERGSSFHEPSAEFVERFGMQSLLTARTIEVTCITLDRYFAGRYGGIDAMDVNVEGHDHQVLQGGTALLDGGELKLLKVEFEVAGVWEGQGWLGDIDSLLRQHRYVLAGIDVEFARPVNARHLFHRGEPLWGKALYAPRADRWQEQLERAQSGGTPLEHTLAKAVALYVAADVPGLALDVLDMSSRFARQMRFDATRIKEQIRSAYRWAKLEYGVSEFVRLAARAARVRGLGSEA